MRVLILQQPSSTSPVDRWLREADPEIELAMVSGVGTSRDEATLSPGMQRFLFEDYRSASTSEALMRICDRWRPDRIVSNAEDDVLRAGHARSVYGIPGQSSAMALLFRDKVQMKRLFARSGLACVSFRAAQSVDDIFDALDEWGATVLKPRRGAGAAGVHVLQDAVEARRLLRSDVTLLAALEEGRLMVEPLIVGAVYHIDIALRGRTALLVSPSVYLAPPHTFRVNNMGSVMLDADGAEHAALCRLARDFVAGLPEGHGANLLHLEVFARPEGGYLAGEVACRLGGGLIKDGIRHTYGVDLSRLGYLLAADLAGEGELHERVGPQTGFVLWTSTTPPPPGERADWCLRMYYSDRTESARDSVDALARCLIAGSSLEEITSRIRMMEALSHEA
jgi:biotin carboxylase